MILPADLEPRAFLGKDSLSYSEAATLMACEQKHFYSYQMEREEQTKSAALARGTETHRVLQHLWRTGEILPTEDETVAWLLDRYVQHYDGGRLDVVAIEQPFAVSLGEPWDGHLFGFVDGLVRVDGELWAMELKTMKDWQRLEQLPVDLQVSLYVWSLRQSGIPVRGVLFDAVRTQRWKRGTERPTAESFERIRIERTAEELDAAVEQLYSALALRDGLTGRRPRVPLKNIGSHCSWCFHRAVCFNQTVNILDDDTLVQ